METKNRKNMKKITKNVTATIRLQINQEIDFTESELQQLEHHLEDNDDISMYIPKNGVLITNPLWDIIYPKIDFDSVECDDIEDFEIEK